MSDAKAQQEPSMEEILASIRRIISEDADGQKPAALDMAMPEQALGAHDDDVLDLTDKVNDDGSVVSLHQGDAASDFPAPRASKPSFSLDPHDDDADEIAFDKDDFSKALMSDTAASSAASAFAELEQEMASPAPPPPRQAAPASLSGSMSVEQLVMDALRPLLKDWLDRNLPSLVEDLVRAEIERVAQGSRRR